MSTVRGIRRSSVTGSDIATDDISNLWKDLTSKIVYIYIPAYVLYSPETGSDLSFARYTSKGKLDENALREPKLVGRTILEVARLIEAGHRISTKNKKIAIQIREKIEKYLHSRDNRVMYSNFKDKDKEDLESLDFLAESILGAHSETIQAKGREAAKVLLDLYNPATLRESLNRGRR